MDIGARKERCKDIVHHKVNDHFFGKNGNILCMYDRMEVFYCIFDDKLFVLHRKFLRFDYKKDKHIHQNVYIDDLHHDHMLNHIYDHILMVHHTYDYM